MDLKNNKFYAVSLRNYIINTFDKLNTSSRFRRKMVGVLYNSGIITDKGRIPGSIILDQLRTGVAKRADIKTYIKFYETESGDTGRDYFDITELEDYIVKMAASLNSFIVLPTMADKKTYYMISGFKLPNYITGNERLTYTTAKEGGKDAAFTTFPTSTLNIFNDYFDTEFATIKEAWRQVKEALGDEKKLLRNYHYAGKNSRTGEKLAANHGNGLRFRHFDMIQVNGTVNGENLSSLVDLNQLIDNFIAEYGEVEGMEKAISFIEDNCINISQKDKLANMNNTLVAALKAELRYADDLGIITYDGNIATANNVNLDAVIFERLAEEYASVSGNRMTSNHATVLNMIANNMVNGIISSVEFEKIVSKDPAFYKDAVDKIKRFSSILSTGDDLRVDFPVGHELHGKTTFTVSEMSDSIIASEDADAIEARILASQFNEMIKNINTEVAASMLPMINNDALPAEQQDQSLTEKFNEIKAEFSEQYEASKAIAKKMTDGYRNVDETDGSAYISPAMYRSILMRRGLWTDDMQVAFDIIEGEDESWMAEDTKYLYIMDIVMNPLKMIYFGDDFKGNINMPILNKMALFCLFKPVATGDLRHIYNRMTKPTDGRKAIDMVPVSQAVKVGSVSRFDLYSDADHTQMNDLSDIEVREQHFEFLRHQLITDPHAEAKISMSWQPVKISMGNVNPSRTYGNIAVGDKEGLTGRELLEEWRNSIVELSRRGADRVIKKFGLKLNPSTGKYDVDKK